MNGYRSDWKVERLGDFALHEKGTKPKRSQKNANDVFTCPYVDIQAFEKGIVKEYTDGHKCVLCEENDFLMVWDGSRSGYVGKAIKGALGSTLMKISFPGIETDYAYYFLQSKYLEINTRAKGTGTPHVDPGILWNYQFAIPPLPEQRAIIAKLEQLFSELDNGIACLKKAQEQLKVYRQAVLKQAFEGELTKAWREQQTSLPSAQELLETIKAEREQAAKLQGKKLKPVIPLTQAELDDLPELPDGWEWKFLEDITLEITDGDHQPPPKAIKGVPFITISNIDKAKNTIDFASSFYVSDQYYSLLKEHRKPRKRDILYTVTGSFGIPVLIDFDKLFCFQRHIGLIRPAFHTISKWLYYLLQTNHVFIQAQNAATGTAQKTVALNSLRKFLVPYCSPQEQSKIVQEIETRLSVCDNIESTIRESLEKAEALRQSILKTAFEGKLLSEEELQITRNAQDWEPAEKLLERIRAEKRTARNKH